MGSGDMRVSALFRYPVKSMQGERLESAVVGTHGVVGDRQWGLLDLDTGLMLTARREPALLMASARLLEAPRVHDAEVDPEVQIELPDGTIVDDDAALSAWLGRRVELRRADPDTAGTYEIALVDIEQGIDDEDVAPWVQWTGPRGSFHDSTKAQVSLVTEGSMRAWDVRRFRPNVVVTGPDGAEDRLVGERLQIGSATFGVRTPIDRCIMTTRPQPATTESAALERDLNVLKRINAERATFLAIGLMVEHTGTITEGDDVRVVTTATNPTGAPT